jgi:trimethylamine--corrinoid protein Co-methyltransferase
VGHVLIRHDVPPPVEPLEAQALLLEYAHKPHSAYFFYAEQLDYAAEIGEIYCGDRRRFSGGGVFLTSPLRLCRRACNLMTKRLDMGFSASAGTMPVVGASVPVTLAGAIAVTAAEILGVWAGYRALAEAVPLGAGIAAGAVDMKTANVSFCSPAAMLLNVGVAEFFRRLCGKAIGIAGAGDYCDGKNPGLRTALEKAHKTMTVAAFTGRHGAVGEGMLDSGKVFSPEQLLIERDLSESLQWLFRPVTVNPETLAEEAILEIGPGLQQAHLTSEHTLAHFRQALRSPRFHDLAPLVDYRPDYDRERRAVAEAHELYLETVARYQPPVVDTDKLRAIHQVVDRARQASGAWDLG